MGESREYRIIQDGIPVVVIEGVDAPKEAAHYAIVYSQNGPVEIQEKIDGVWEHIAYSAMKAGCADQGIRGQNAKSRAPDEGPTDGGK